MMLTMFVHPFPLDAVAVGIMLKSQNAIDAVSSGSGLGQLSGRCMCNNRYGSSRRRCRDAATSCYVMGMFRFFGRLVSDNPVHGRTTMLNQMSDNMTLLFMLIYHLVGRVMRLQQLLHCKQQIEIKLKTGLSSH